MVASRYRSVSTHTPFVIRVAGLRDSCGPATVSSGRRLSMLGVRTTGLLVVLAAFAPLTAYAQGSITGVVRDTSGAVLPGVTVEVTSPALIEKVRTTVSDDMGQYRIVDLRPGSYKATFTLTGFNTVVREGIELVGSFTATINAEMGVGAVQETITVAADSPVVDLQNTSRQHVISNEVIDAIPAGRSHYDLAALIPGLTGVQFGRSGFQDVGGPNNLQIAAFTVTAG